VVMVLAITTFVFKETSGLMLNSCTRWLKNRPQ
jgi:hypothetical protein